MREQQAQQDCFYFLQGRCAKGSLCPFKHDEVGAGSRLQRVLRPGCLHDGPQLWKGPFDANVMPAAGVLCSAEQAARPPEASSGGGQRRHATTATAAARLHHRGLWFARLAAAAAAAAGTASSCTRAAAGRPHPSSTQGRGCQACSGRSTTCTSCHQACTCSWSAWHRGRSTSSGRQLRRPPLAASGPAGPAFGCSSRRAARHQAAGVRWARAGWVQRSCSAGYRQRTLTFKCCFAVVS